jgi:hypothetical protein
VTRSRAPTPVSIFHPHPSPVKRPDIPPLSQGPPPWLWAAIFVGIDTGLWVNYEGQPLDTHSQMPGPQTHTPELHLAWTWACCVGACILQPLRPPSPPLSPAREQRGDHQAWTRAVEPSPAVPEGGRQPRGGARLSFAPEPAPNA